MNKKILKAVSVCAIICIAFTIFTSAAKNPETAVVKDLLQRRTYIMENTLLGRISYEEGSRQLAEIETDSLYSRDMESLRTYQNTDLAVTEKMEITSIEKKSDMYDKASFKCSIKWIESYGEDKTIRTCTYDVGIQKQDGKCKLISFRIQ